MLVFDIFKGFELVEGLNDFSRGCYFIVIEEKELMENQNLLKIDKAEIEQCLDFFQPSKINFFDGYIFISVNLLYKENQNIAFLDFNIFLTKENVIIVVRKYNNVVEKFIEEISKATFILKEKPYSDILVYYILDRIIIKNYDVISELEEDTDKIEISILKGPNRKHIEELIKLRRSVYRIRKFINPLRYIGDSLIGNDNEVIDKENIRYFNNLNNKINKLLQNLDSLVQDLGQVREAFEAETANKSNELMKVFTLITGIFLPINVISSIIGMNLKGMPFKDHNHGFYYVCGIMVGLTLCLLVYFKRKKWL